MTNIVPNEGERDFRTDTTRLPRIPRALWVAVCGTGRPFVWLPSGAMIVSGHRGIRSVLVCLQGCACPMAPSFAVPLDRISSRLASHRTAQRCLTAAGSDSRRDGLLAPLRMLSPIRRSLVVGLPAGRTWWQAFGRGESAQMTVQSGSSTESEAFAGEEGMRMCVCYLLRCALSSLSR